MFYVLSTGTKTKISLLLKQAAKWPFNLAKRRELAGTLAKKWALLPAL